MTHLSIAIAKQAVVRTLAALTLLGMMMPVLSQTANLDNEVPCDTDGLTRWLKTHRDQLKTEPVLLQIARRAYEPPPGSGAWLHSKGIRIPMLGGPPAPRCERTTMHEVQKRLLAAGANPNLRNSFGTTALMLAAKENDDRLLTLLLAAGADIGAVDENGDSALHFAAGSFSPGDSTMKLLLQAGADARQRNALGVSVLRPAIEAGSPERIKQLFKAGANPRLLDREGRSDLAAAASGRRHTANDKVLDVLLALLGGIDARDDAGFTALMWAARSQTDTLSLLLERGASVNLAAADGTTALMLGAQTCSTYAIEPLLAAHAQVNAVDAQGASALERLVLHFRVDTCKIIDDRAGTVQALLSGGASTRTLSAPAAVMVAALQGDHALLVRALARDPKAKQVTDRDGWSALHIAVLRNQLQVIQTLIAQGADLEAQEKILKRTPLMVAVARQQLDAVRMLCRAGADPLRREWLGQTSIEKAKEMSRADIVEVLSDCPSRSPSQRGTTRKKL